MTKRLLLCVTLCASLAACASAPPPRVAGSKIDVQKVATVNQWAETKGARVLWVRYPTVDVTAQTAN
jgi:starvation-inducible outer membrane lipoprotein